MFHEGGRMRIVVGITGASGVEIGSRLVEVLSELGHEVEAIVSRGAREVAKTEAPTAVDRVREHAVEVYEENDLHAPVSSSSYRIDAMVVCPCSMKTLSAVANGYADNLVARAAENCLKLARPLVLVPRDSPLSLPSLENMVKAKRAGAWIVPPTLAFYPKPEGLGEMVDFVVGKVLDCLDIEHALYRKWGEEK